MDAILNGIKDVLQAGLFGLLDLILWLLTIIVKVVLTPVDLIFRTFLPNLSDILYNFSNGLLMISNFPFAYFFHMLPPLTQIVLSFWITLMISYYSIIWGYRAIVFIPKVINKVKFW